MNVNNDNNSQGRLAQLANQFVNQAFYGTLLREFRQGNRPSMFDKGPGGTTFVRQLDMELVKRMAPRGDSPLAQALLSRLERSQAGRLYGSLNVPARPETQAEGANGG